MSTKNTAIHRGRPAAKAGARFNCLCGQPWVCAEHRATANYHVCRFCGWRNRVEQGLCVKCKSAGAR